MPRSGSEHPTELELEILKVLWDEAPASVREVRGRLDERAGRRLSHSSVITMLNIMVGKGYVTRRKQGKAFLFTPKVAKENVAGGMMGDLLERIFDGSPSAMVLNLLDSTDLDADELAELRRLIGRKAKERKK